MVRKRCGWHRTSEPFRKAYRISIVIVRVPTFHDHLIGCLPRITKEREQDKKADRCHDPDNGCHRAGTTTWETTSLKEPQDSNLRFEHGFFGAGGAALDPLVDHRQDHYLDWPGYQASDDHDRQRFLDFRAGAGRDDERNQTNAADQGALV